MLLAPENLTCRTTCRSCGGPLDPLLDLGSPALSSFVKPEDPDPPSAPLAAVICQTCDLVQLSVSVNPQLLYGEQYWYHSGINEIMVEELNSIAKEVCWRVPLTRTTRVLDIGANDGTLLHQYALLRGDQCPTRMAVEPAASLIHGLADKAHTVIHGYFPQGTYAFPSASIQAITSIACFYDIEDPRAAVREIDRLLTPVGVWILQLQDLLQMVKATAWDNFCFEHLTYYSLHTFELLLRGTDLHVIAVEPRTINGGSIRIVVARRSQAPELSVDDWRRAEAGLTRRRLSVFAWEAREHCQRLAETVRHYVMKEGIPIDLYACSTKANTLLQWAAIHNGLIRVGVERSPFKVGLVTGGTRIPIVSEETWRADPAPICVLGAWQFRDAVIQRESAYLERGGTFLVPLPVMEVIRGRS
jgi:NDP-4-keto-2,6-dideoxyhexose 3-C-methyltransferase